MPEVRVLLVLVGVRHLGDVRRGSETYAAKQAGADPAERPAGTETAISCTPVAPKPPIGAPPCAARLMGRRVRAAAGRTCAARTVVGMKHETPRATDGAKLCAWCGEPIQQASLGRSRDYCKRSCRQRAYEARKQREAVVAAVASAVARRPASDSSRDEMPGPANSSRDEMRLPGRRPIPTPAEPVADSVLPSAWRASSIPPGPSRSKRRRLLPPPPGAERPEVLPLFDDGQE